MKERDQRTAEKNAALIQRHADKLPHSLIFQKKIKKERRNQEIKRRERKKEKKERKQKNKKEGIKERKNK